MGGGVLPKANVRIKLLNKWGIARNEHPWREYEPTFREGRYLDWKERSNGGGM